MDIEIIIIVAVIGIASLAIGIFLGKLIFKGSYKAQETAAVEKAAHILKEAEVKAEVMKKDKLLEAKEKFYQLKVEHEKAIYEREKNVVLAENKIKQKDQQLSQKLEQTQRKEKEVDALRQNLSKQTEVIEKKKEELEKAHQRKVEQLEKIAGLSVDAAKAQLVEALKEEATVEAVVRIKEITDEAKLTANKKPRKLLFRPFNALLLNMQ